MANEIEKLNTIEIADIEKVNTLTDDNIENINTFEFTGSITYTFLGTRGILGGGQGNAYTNVIQYKLIGSDGNSSDFADLTATRNSGTGSSNVTRGILTGGTEHNGSPTYGTTSSDYITVGNASAGVADAGDLDQGTTGMGSGSNGTLMFVMGGYVGSSDSYTANMQYFTIDTTNGSTQAGDLNEGATGSPAASSGFTRSLIALGYVGGLSDTVEYHAFHTSNNAADFHNLTAARNKIAAFEDNTRVIFAGGYEAADVDTMEYFTIASAATAQDAGNLVGGGRREHGANSNGTLGEIYGGEAGGTIVNIIEKKVIQSTANSIDVGDLTTAGLTGGATKNFAALSGT